MLTTIERWKDIVLSETGNIEVWHLSPEEYAYSRGDTERQRKEKRSDLYIFTTAIVSNLASQHPGLDTRAILNVHKMIDHWLHLRSARKLPNLLALQGIVDQAVMTVNAAEHAILDKTRDSDDRDTPIDDPPVICS